jgi:two-component system cell cycle response regulator CtrA
MNIVSFVPVHPCREAIFRAAIDRGDTPILASDERHFFGLLSMDTASFGIMSSADRMVLEATSIRNFRNCRGENPLYVLLLGRGSDHSSIARALVSGADQAEVWPVDHRLLSAQIGAVVARSRDAGEGQISFGGVRFIPGTGEVIGDGGRIHLTRFEATILQCLVRFPNRPVSKEEIYNAVYDGRGSTNLKIIDVFMCKLRKKLSALCERDHIETIWGNGFKFIPKGFEATTTQMRVMHSHRIGSER